MQTETNTDWRSISSYGGPRALWQKYAKKKCIKSLSILIWKNPSRGGVRSVSAFWEGKIGVAAPRVANAVWVKADGLHKFDKIKKDTKIKEKKIYVEKKINKETKIHKNTNTNRETKIEKEK